MSDTVTIWTIGHSSRPWAEFAVLLREFSIAAVCDIRAWPSSRKFPHFDGEAMRAALAAEGIAYHWLGKDLGGRRSSGLGDASPNLALRTPGFRNYADHMRSEAFQRALDELAALAVRARTAVMCAEAHYRRCHRWLLSDTLVVRGLRVTHILGPGASEDHQLSDIARIADGYATYPPEDDLLNRAQDT